MAHVGKKTPLGYGGKPQSVKYAAASIILFASLSVAMKSYKFSAACLRDGTKLPTVRLQDSSTGYSLQLPPNAEPQSLEAKAPGLRGKPWPGQSFGKHQFCLPQGSKHSDGSLYLDLRKRIVWPWIEFKSGLEVGALQSPFAVPETTKVRYVDSQTLEQMRMSYPELSGVSLVAPDIVDKAETLATVADESVDFVLASHVLEHTESPITAVHNMLRVVRTGGVVILVIPMKCEIFDRHRVVTSWAHMLAEYMTPAVASANAPEHYREWAAGFQSGVAGHPVTEDVQAKADTLAASKYPIHFHTWDQVSVYAFIASLTSVLGLPAEVVEYNSHKYETVVVLRRTGEVMPAVP